MLKTCPFKEIRIEKRDGNTTTQRIEYGVCDRWNCPFFTCAHGTWGDDVCRRVDLYLKTGGNIK